MKCKDLIMELVYHSILTFACPVLNSFFQLQSYSFQVNSLFFILLTLDLFMSAFCWNIISSPQPL